MMKPKLHGKTVRKPTVILIVIIVEIMTNILIFIRLYEFIRVVKSNIRKRSCFNSEKCNYSYSYN